MKRKAALDFAVQEARRLLSVFGETGWEFRVVFDKQSTDYANVATLSGQRRFTLTLGPAFLSDTDEGRANTMLHEILHVLQRGLRDLTQAALEPVLSTRERRLFLAAFDQLMELHTDQLATVFAGKI